MNNLKFADDVILTGKNIHELPEMYNEFTKYTRSQKTGLRTNVSKTKLMSDNKEEKIMNNDLQQLEIEKVQEYRYMSRIPSL